MTYYIVKFDYLRSTVLGLLKTPIGSGRAHMNISKFVVLGTLDQLKTGSGYDIIRELDKKMISHWTNVKKGSIYHALKSLAKGGRSRK